ncbi:phage head-tail joining protein [Aeromonas aquatica]|uniref:phage head-tail joining protein n=1 Tax=Aeromonas aquatica TaxID=558964 RepID=UPI00051ABA88|nr:hypothetical protein [Aeromonas aquatica]
MAFTQEDIQNLNEAIATGELSVVVDGREITYRSIKELMEAKRHIIHCLRKGSSPFAGYRVQLDRGIR